MLRETGRCVAAVGLVEHQKPVYPARTDLYEHLVDRRDRTERVRSGTIDDMDQQVGVADHVERGLERRHQLMGQLLDEADRVGRIHRFSSRQRQAAGRGVESREQAVLDQHVGAGDPVQQRRLAGVGVADERHRPVPGPTPGLGLSRPVCLDPAQVGLELVDPSQELAATHLELGLPGAAGADPAGLLGVAAREASQPRQPVAELSQFDLRPALGRAGILGEHVEDDRGAVERCAAQDLLQVELLRGAELVVEHNRVGVGRLDDRLDLLRLSRPDEGGGVHGAATLHHPFDCIGAGGVDQQFELVERGVHRLGRVVAPHHSDQHDPLAEGPLDQSARHASELAEAAPVRLLVALRPGLGVGRR